MYYHSCLHGVSTIGSVSFLRVKGVITTTLVPVISPFCTVDGVQNLLVKFRSGCTLYATIRPHNFIVSCTIPHLIRIHFSQARRGLERVITGDRVTNKQHIGCVEARRATNRTIRSDLWQRMATEQPSGPSPVLVCLQQLHDDYLWLTGARYGFALLRQRQRLQ
jgi:hypothetical protein